MTKELALLPIINRAYTMIEVPVANQIKNIFLSNNITGCRMAIFNTIKRIDY